MAEGPRKRVEISLARGTSLRLKGRPLVMGVVNVTPDSFSDGGHYLAPTRAVERGLALLDQGADLLDLGAESTRPGGGVYGEGADEVSVDEEWRRLEPALRLLRESTDAPISVDTRKGEVASRALAAGADLLNDVQALRDPASRRAAAKAGCPVILMHSRGELGSMQRGIHFAEVVADVGRDLRDAFDRAVDSGVAASKILIDPGIGFGKRVEHNLLLLRHLERLRDLAPIVVGASRKSFIAQVAGDAPPERRLGGSLAAVAWAARAGAAMVRVHDVAETVQFLEVWEAVRKASAETEEPIVEAAWT